MAIQIQLRRGTASQWTTANTTLAEGEIGFETDTGKIKIGKGNVAWNSLAYWSGGDGLEYQPLDADLTAIAALTGTGILKRTGSNTWALDTETYLSTTTASSTYLSQSSASSTYAPLSSPALTGTPTSTTAAADTNTTQIATTAYVVGQASSSNPAMDGSAASGTSLKYARADHVHPSDTSRAPTASPTFTGTVTTPLTTAGLVTTTSGGVLGSSSYSKANADLMGFTTTATAGGTTPLSASSTSYQIFTGTTTQTVTLPVTSTLSTGWTFHIVNNSTGNLTVNSSGGNLVITVLPGITSMVTCIGTTLTTAADWEAGLTEFSTATGTGSVVLSASPTLTGTLTASSITATGTVLGVEDIVPYSKTGTLTVSTGTIRYRFPWAATLLGVTAAVNTAPTGASLICDVNKNGTTIFTTQANRPTIAAAGTATTTEPTPDVTAIVAGDYLTVDVDQIGSTVAGSDLTVMIRYKRA